MRGAGRRDGAGGAGRAGSLQNALQLQQVHDAVCSHNASEQHVAARETPGCSRAERRGGVVRVDQDGWERAGVAMVWSALMSHGFYLMRAANNILITTRQQERSQGGGAAEATASTKSTTDDAKKAGESQEMTRRRLRADAARAMLVSISRFETLRRLFAGRCFNPDLTRNTGQLSCSSFMLVSFLLNLSSVSKG